MEKTQMLETADGKAFLYNKIENGWGDVHINRFRIHFLAENKCLLQTFPNSLYNNFEQIFSGTAPRTQKNRASVRKHAGDMGGEYLQFDLNLDLDLDHMIGQFRDDWVRVGWKKDRRGFAVDTMAYLISPWRLLAPVFAGPSMRHHFLCGRRSWVIFKLQEWIDAIDRSRERPISKGYSLQTDQEHTCQRDEIFVLETAAIERFSGNSIRLRNWLTNGIQKDIISIWCTMLENFVKFHELKAIDPPDGYAFPEFQLPREQLGNVYYELGSFDSAYECRSNEVTGQIRRWHPYLDKIDLHYELID
jgi:hypothetical protein